MYHCLVTIEPLHRDGTRRELRLASANLREITGLFGQIWEPALVTPPTIDIGLFNGDFQAAVSPGTATLPIATATAKKTYPWIHECDFSGAPVEIRAGRVGEEWPVVFVGRVESYDGKGDVLTLIAEAWFDDENVLTKTYAGTDLAEGPTDLKGKVKPLAIGWPRNVEPVLINAVSSVFQFSAYGEIEAVEALYERGSSFGAAAGDHADYAALVAATIAPGAWATCLAEGLVRLGAPPYGVITGDIKGHVVGTETPRLTGEIIAALADLAGIDPERLNTASLDAMDLAVPYPVSLVLGEQMSFSEIARRMALPCNYQSGISLKGQFFVTGISLDQTPAFRLDVLGRSLPQVIETVEESTSPPFWRTVLGAARSWRVHTADEIAYSATLARHDPASTATTFTANHVGDLDSGQLPRVLAFKRYKGDADVSSVATWSLVSQGAISGGTVTVTGGAVEIPSGSVIPLATTIQIKSVHEGSEVNSTILVNRLDAGAPSTGGSGGTTVTDNTLNTVSGTTKVALSDIMTVKTGSAGTITFGGSLSIIAPNATPNGSFGAAMRWQWRAVGGSFADVGAADLTESVEALVWFDADLGVRFSEDGSISVADSKTGLSASTDYEIQLWGARDTSSPTKTISFGGSASATGS